MLLCTMRDVQTYHEGIDTGKLLEEGDGESDHGTLAVFLSEQIYPPGYLELYACDARVHL